jgi:hypothetical protein
MLYTSRPIRCSYVCMISDKAWHGFLVKTVCAWGGGAQGLSWLVADEANQPEHGGKRSRTLNIA